MTIPDDDVNDGPRSIPRPRTAIKGRGAVQNPKGRFGCLLSRTAGFRSS